MLNGKYSYDHIELWNADAWENRASAAYPLFLWIEETNYEKFRIVVPPDKFKNRTDGIADAHSHSVSYGEILEKWKKRGLTYRISRMGDVCWFLMLPDAVLEGKEKEPKILVIPCSTDYYDSRYAMEILDQYGKYNETAAEHGIVLLYAVSNTPDKDNLLSSVLMELGSLYHLSLKNLYLDVSTVYGCGLTLRDIPNFTCLDSDGKRLDPEAETLYGIPVFNISGRWQTNVSNIYSTATAKRMKGGTFDLERHIHSICGQKMAEAMVLEHRFRDTNDPALKEYWRSRGAEYGVHETKGERWISLVPSGAAESGEKLPVMLVFRETSENNPYLPMIAMSGYYGYCELAAQGELILLFFALETPDDNDLFWEILNEASEAWPIDRSRVYVTGHSHNGFYACEFMRRHHKGIAGVATQGNSMGLYGPGYSGSPRLVTDEAIDLMETFDMPLINICGSGENDYVNLAADSAAYENMLDAFQRRLKSARCPMKTKEEIRTARESSDYAERKLGVPVDRSEVIFMYGRECYCGVIRNVEGKEYLKMVVVDNLPHITIPQTTEFSWGFLRRFARDPGTGLLEERY